MAANTPASAFPNGGRLNDLSTYTQWSWPGDGDAAAYYGYDVNVEFTETYVDALYATFLTSDAPYEYAGRPDHPGGAPALRGPQPTPYGAAACRHSRAVGPAAERERQRCRRAGTATDDRRPNPPAPPRAKPGRCSSALGYPATEWRFRPPLSLRRNSNWNAGRRSRWMRSPSRPLTRRFRPPGCTSRPALSAR